MLGVIQALKKLLFCLIIGIRHEIDQLLLILDVKPIILRIVRYAGLAINFWLLPYVLLLDHGRLLAQHQLLRLALLAVPDVGVVLRLSATTFVLADNFSLGTRGLHALKHLH